jgi:2-alkyl-3-oxoalkanoate reductase
MKVAIIGASGMVGSRIVESFHLGDGPNPVAIVRHPSRLILPARFVLDVRVADALDPDSLARALAGCSAAVHVAHSDAAASRTMPAILCRAAAQARVRRLVYLSTAAVYGDTPAPGTDESSPLHTRHETDDTNARVAAERSFFAECREHALAGYALRPAVVFGPRSRLIAQLAADLRDERAWLVQNGEGVCNSLYIDNLVHAVRLCLKARNGAGQPYLLNDAEAVTWRDFYETLAQHLGFAAHRIHSVDLPPSGPEPWRKRALPPATPPPGPLPDDWTTAAARPPTPTPELARLQRGSWRFPATRAARDLGYRATVSFTEAMRRTAAWWRFAQGEFAPAL